MRTFLALLAWSVMVLSPLGCATQAIRQSGQISHDLAKNIHNDVMDGNIPDPEDTKDLVDGTRVMMTYAGEPDVPVPIDNKALRKKTIKQGQEDADAGFLGLITDWIETNPVLAAVGAFTGTGTLVGGAIWVLRKLQKYQAVAKKFVGVVHQLPPSVQTVIRGGLGQALGKNERKLLDNVVSAEKIKAQDLPKPAVLEVPGLSSKA